MWLEDFLKKIRSEWNPVKIILFGSRAKGSPLMFSDVDLLVVSPKFHALHYLERKYKLINCWEGLIDLEIICLTPKEFAQKKNEIGIIREIINTGIEL
jgi:predicted nucleotidyltransferase